MDAQNFFVYFEMLENVKRKIPILYKLSFVIAN